MLDVVVIGNIDLETRIEASPIPNDGGFEIGSISERIGGSAIDICVLCSSLGINPSIVSSIGMDASGILSIMEKSKIDYSHIIISETKTGKLIDISTPGERSTFLFKGANRHLMPHSLDYNFLKKSKMVHLCPCNSDIFKSLALKSKDTLLSCKFDPSYSMDDLNANIDFLFIDQRDLLRMAGTSDVAAAGASFLDRGPLNVIVLDGGRGISVLRQDGRYEISLDVDETFDGSEFFESFYSGFLYRYIKTSNLKSSLSFGLAYQFFSHKERNRLLFKDIDEIEDKMYSIMRSNNE